MSTYDFVAIGDITTDAFIRLKEPAAHCEIDHGNEELCMGFGDKIPYEFVEVVRAVGNSPNAAVAAARLGLRSALVSNLGDDQNGRECLESLEKNGVGVKFVDSHKGKETNYHYVLWFEDDRTILIKHHDYDRTLPDFGEPKWIYFSSIGAGTEKYHDAIAKYLGDHPKINLCFQPGTFQIALGSDRLAEIYKRTELVAVNKKEAAAILKTESTDLKELLLGLLKLGPKTALVTDGRAGAYYADGTRMYFMPTYPDPKPPLDRTGAGDSFTSTFVSMMALGKLPLEALQRAPINSMSVVQEIGAQKGLLSFEKIESIFNKAPKDFGPREI